MLNSDTNLIGTMQEFKESMYGYISDASKDAQGFRTRFDYTTRTAEELMSEAVYWEGQVVETMNREAIEEAERKVEFEAAIANTIANGAADRNTAIRWMYEGECIAENWNMNTLSSIFQASHKGALIIGFDSATIPKLVGGKSNPMQGRVTKVMTGAVAMVNRNYENARNKQLQVAGFKPTFTVKPRKWGIYAIKGMPVLTHKGAVYLNTSILKAGAVSYLLDGKAIDKAQIEGLPVSRGVGIDKASVSTQLADMTDAERASIAVFKGLLDEATANPDSMSVDSMLMADIVDNTKDLFPRDFKAESITALRVNRTEYTDIDSEVV